MKFLLRLMDSFIASLLRVTVKGCLWIASVYIMLTYRMGKSKTDQKAKLIDFGKNHDRLQQYFSMPHSNKQIQQPKPIEENKEEFNNSDPIYSEDYDEAAEFDKIKKYLTKKAVEMGGTINWYQSPDGLIIYLYEFDNDKTYRAFEQIMKDVSLNGIKEEIDGDIEDLLSDIENNLGK